jgi:hypothetical protein
MAKAKKTARKSKRTRKTAARPPRANDAIALLKADHRQVEEWFEQFEATRSSARKNTLAGQICQALKVHTEIEEEIFYPQFLEATGEVSTHHEAEVEHNGAKRLIEEIESGGAEDDYFDAKVKVLSEMIKHHVNEEEKRDGMFVKARQSKMDLTAIGARLAARKAELMGTQAAEEGASADDSAEPTSSRPRRTNGGVARLTRHTER